MLNQHCPCKIHSSWQAPYPRSTATHRFLPPRDTIAVQHGRDELLVVNLPAAINVTGMEQVLHLVLVDGRANLWTWEEQSVKV